MKNFLFGETCTVWWCFKKPWMYLRITPGRWIKAGSSDECTEVGYCERHARMVDEMFRERDIKTRGEVDYKPL